MSVPTRAEILSEYASFRLLDAPVFPVAPEGVASGGSAVGMGAMLQRSEQVCRLSLVPAWIVCEVECRAVPWNADEPEPATSVEAPSETRMAAMTEPVTVPADGLILANSDGPHSLGAAPESSIVDAIRFRDVIDASNLFSPSDSRTLAALR